ncbi:DUF4440 domain-containing protein [Alkalicoccobacillus murimartini]|uniref:DUF4440 domain-containing protein n=1 Tax=Alkalicoccobacillus murimartini TaxID=171685 RepID=A0ABT9YN39_9BACI|nr:DUF4440 domain-containing protein [Alkalicoccobacillus murimartini]MDQ0208617.1 hypothetical protein [Alkalicoccobacillus murimartini]
MANSTLLQDFETFFSKYQEVWNECNAEKMIKLLSPELAIRWTGPGTAVSDWGYEESKIGWAQAYEQYKGHKPKWHFNQLHITPANDKEVIAMFWLTFEMDGKVADVVKLFVQRFRKEGNDDWKLIREYCESIDPDHFVSNH